MLAISLSVSEVIGVILRRVASYLSLSRAAGKLISGESAVEKGLRAGSVKLVITAADASANTKKKFSRKAFYYGVPFFCVFLMEEIGAATGLRGRATIAVTDEGFAGKLLEILKDSAEVD